MSKAIFSGWSRITCAAGLLGAVAGCDAQVDSTYVGEPLAQITGAVRAAPEYATEGQDVRAGVYWAIDATPQYVCEFELDAPDDPECVSSCGEVPACDDFAGLHAWDSCAGSCPGGISAVVNEQSDLFAGRAVGTTTPSLTNVLGEFTLTLIQPPPPEALIDMQGVQVAVGGFILVDPAGEPYELDVAQATEYPPWLLGGSTDFELFYAADTIEAGTMAARFFAFDDTPVEAGYYLLRRNEGANPAPIDSPITLVLGDPNEIFGPLNELQVDE